jgi:hypothetical protein
MTTPFETLLHDLGKVFHLALHTDRSNACTLQIHRELKIQLELDPTQEQLWIFCKLIEVPPGKFREEVLKEALKANDRPDPRSAIFGYIRASNHLALFQKYPLQILDGKNLSELIGTFAAIAENWRIAILRGRSAPLARDGLP